MRGTEKQVAWAEQIRTGVIGELESADRDWSGLIEFLGHCDDAGFWIDLCRSATDAIRKYGMRDGFKRYDLEKTISAGYPVA